MELKQKMATAELIAKTCPKSAIYRLPYLSLIHAMRMRAEAVPRNYSVPIKLLLKSYSHKRSYCLTQLSM